MDTNTILVAISIFVGLILIVFFFSIQGQSSKKKVVKKEPKCLIIAGPYSTDEVSKHNHREDAWIIVDNKVYDITDFIDMHPGGDTILNNVGGDSTVGFKGPQHPVNAWDVLNERYIGDLIIKS